MIRVIAENSLPACQALQKPEKLQKTAYLPDNLYK
jgi:hypothetical protein